MSSDQPGLEEEEAPTLTGLCEVILNLNEHFFLMASKIIGPLYVLTSLIFSATL